MASLKTILERRAMHSFLLPVFFILHLYIAYYGMVTPGDALTVFAWLELAVIAAFLLSWWLTGHRHRSAAIVTAIATLYLYYGDIKQFLSTLSFSFLARYAVLLPLVVAGAVAIIIICRRKKKFTTLNLYLNLLMAVFIIVDLVRLLALAAPGAQAGKSLVNGHSLLPAGVSARAAGKPDIYFLVFDSYPNSRLLEQYAGTPAPVLDSFLAGKGFHLIPRSTSNYNNTPFSIDATVNMRYLNKLATPLDLSPIDYNKATSDINHAPLFAFLSGEGYKIYNLSVFEIDNQPPLHKENFLTATPTRLLLFNTLWQCVRHDIFWHFRRQGGNPANAATALVERNKEVNESKLYFNRQVLDSIPHIAAVRGQAPRFVYAHIYMPHYPYFYDSSGKRYHDTATYGNFVYDDAKFISYLKYTNTQIKMLLSQLMTATAGKSVIIVQSDHGYRGFAFTDIRNHFKNLHAVYFPDHDYSSLYDSISNVNTFRVVINKYFHGQMPLLPDSCIVVKD